jgi:L,D-peptidoglycan transpeptidase YkuD (ErfK/YbiS/YcfS/YnhG family)
MPDITVCPLASMPTRGILTWGPYRWPCALGKGGVTQDKREGDGATPLGRYPLRWLYYRPDHICPAPTCSLPIKAIGPNDGWCDDPTHAAYNQPVVLPFSPSHEVLWREDRVYDLIVVLGHNDSPPQPGKGSAIFMHVARPGYRPTEGCVALAAEHLTTLLSFIDPDTHISILAHPAPSELP